MPDPAKLDMVPPTVVISLALKSETASLSVKVMVAVSPDFKAEVEELMVMVGATVSTVMEIVLEAVLLLPALSVKVPAATLKVASVVLLLVGVKVAVYVKPDPAKLESAPPITVILEEIKAVEAASLRVKVRVAVWPEFKAVLSELMVMVGAMVSTVMEIVLEAVLGLPALSVKVPAATLKVAVAVVFAVGVKVAV